jgi:hypothetical protein
MKIGCSLDGNDIRSLAGSHFTETGASQISKFWVGEPQMREVKTDSIPVSLRQIGTWVTILFPPFEVVGAAQP